MKVLITVYKTIKMEKEVFVGENHKIIDMVDNLDDEDYDYQETVDFDVRFERIPEVEDIA